MKSLKILAVIILLAVACTTAFAATKQTADVTIRKNVTVGTSELKAGEYSVAIEINGSDAKVTFLKNSKPVATAAGKYSEAKSFGFGIALITDGAALKQLQGDKLKGTVELAN